MLIKIWHKLSRELVQANAGSFLRYEQIGDESQSCFDKLRNNLFGVQSNLLDLPTVFVNVSEQEQCAATVEQPSA